MKLFKILILIALISSLLLADVSIPLNDPNIAYEGVWFPEIDSNRVIFNRHTEEVLTNGESGISATSKVYAYTQTGIRIRFSTDSPTIQMSFEPRDGGGKMGLTQAFAVFADSTIINVFETLVFTIDSPKPDSIVNYEVTLPSLHAVNFTGLTLKDGHQLSTLPANNLPDYVAVGNSITNGTGHQSATHLTYPFIMAQTMKWNLTNLAVAGARTGWPIAQLFRDKPVDFVTILLGFNDWMWDNKTLEYKIGQYTKLLDTLRYYQPAAKIFCITPLTTTKTDPQYQVPFTLQQYREALARTINRRSSRSGDPNLFLIHGDSISTKSMLMDGIHLGQAGAPLFAAKLTTKIKEILATPVNIKNTPSHPKKFNLNRVYPNPFNPATFIEYELANAGLTQIDVYDLAGNKIKELLNRQQGAGQHVIPFHADGMSSGLYIIHLNHSNQTQQVTATEKCLLLK
ncbi:MAG: GDSL-type esterase/lipase family protein [Fidelibacterota bacterium]